MTTLLHCWAFVVAHSRAAGLLDRADCRRHQSVGGQCVARHAPGADRDRGRTVRGRRLLAGAPPPLFHLRPAAAAAPLDDTLLRCVAKHCVAHGL